MVLLKICYQFVNVVNQREYIMNNPFENVPLNTKKVFVLGITNDGCKIYLPLNTLNEMEQIKKKDELQEYLNARNDFMPKILA